MRVIKFRGFHADENGQTVIKLNGKEIRGFWFYGDLHTDGPYINEHLVIPETVGQYTGLDDVNRREIFEGDIVKYAIYPKDNFEVHEVTFDHGVFGCKDAGCGLCVACMDGVEEYSLKVIGNIFENPEIIGE